MNRSLVLTDPNVLPTVPAHTQPRGKRTLPASGLSPLSSPTPRVSVRVNVIALSRKGLASHNAKNKFPPTARALPHTCLLLPGPSFILEGYFVLSAALSSITKWSHTFLSLYYMVVCRYTCRNTREYKLYFIDRLIQNLFIYQWHKSQKKNQIFFPHGCKLPSFLLTHLQSPAEARARQALSVECF